jgi:hypothetical protein
MVQPTAASKQRRTLGKSKNKLYRKAAEPAFACAVRGLIPVCKPGGYPSVIFTGFPARAPDNATGCVRPDESGPCAREATLRRLIYPSAGGHADA